KGGNARSMGSPFPPDCQAISSKSKMVSARLGRRDPREVEMHDIVIRGGTIVDGTGKAAFSGDVAIADGKIAAVGGKQGPAPGGRNARGRGGTTGGRVSH